MSFSIQPRAGLEGLKHILRDADGPSPSLPIDGSMLEEIMRCPRASLFKHIYRRSAAVPKPELLFGAALHKAIEVGLKGGDLETQYKALTDCYTTDTMPEDDYRHLGRAKEVVQAYWQGYEWGDPGEDNHYVHEGYSPAQWKVVDVEKPFSLVLGRIEGVLPKPITILWEGKMDLLVDEGGLYPVDTKTSKDKGYKYWNTYTGPCSSMVGYCWRSWRRTGQMPAGFIIDSVTVRKPTERVTNRTPPRNEFERRPFQVTPDQIKAWEVNTLFTIEDWLRHAARGYWPQYDRKGFNCSWCQYQQVCSVGDDRSAWAVLQSGQFEDYTWSPLKKDN